MKIEKLIPISPHSTESGFGGAYNTENYLFCRAVEFKPNAATRTARDQLIYESLINQAKHASQRKIEAEEIIAGKAYIGDIWTYLQHWRTLSNIKSLAPRFVNNYADGAGKNVWSIDEIETEMQNVETTKLLTFPALEAVIHEMNPIWELEYPHDIQNTPGAYFLGWAPSLTVTEADTLRKSLSDYTDLFQNLCDKLGVSISPLSVSKFCSTAVPVIKPMDFNDYRWRFWAFSGLWWSVLDNVGPDEFIHIPSPVGSPATEDIDAEGDETWLTDGNMGYISEDPHAFNAIIKMLYKYYATDNPLGCAYNGDANTFGVAAPSNDEAYVYDIAANDVSGGDKHKTWVVLDDTEIKKLLMAAFGTFLDTTTYAATKDLDGVVSVDLYGSQVLGGFRYLTYKASVWNTNYNKERAFFSHIFRGGKSNVSKRTRRANRTNREPRTEKEDKG